MLVLIARCEAQGRSVPLLRPVYRKQWDGRPSRFKWLVTLPLWHVGADTGGGVHPIAYGGSARRTAWHLPGLEHHAGGARPFHQGQICNYVGGMMPFVRTRAERLATGDPRFSLEECYGSHEGYVSAVRKAADGALAARFLLPEDAQRLVSEAEGSQVLR